MFISKIIKKVLKLFIKRKVLINILIDKKDMAFINTLNKVGVKIINDIHRLNILSKKSDAVITTTIIETGKYNITEETTVLKFKYSIYNIVYTWVYTHLYGSIWDVKSNIFIKKKGYLIPDNQAWHGNDMIILDRCGRIRILTIDKFYSTVIEKLVPNKPVISNKECNYVEIGNCELFTLLNAEHNRIGYNPDGYVYIDGVLHAKFSELDDEHYVSSVEIDKNNEIHVVYHIIPEDVI